MPDLLPLEHYAPVNSSFGRFKTLTSVNSVATVQMFDNTEENESFFGFNLQVSYFVDINLSSNICES